MLIISIDLGCYSVKFITSKIMRKTITHQSSSEVVIDLDELNIQDEFALWELQFNIVRNFLANINEEYRLILNAPSDLFTTRFVQVPVTNRKKAQLMIPFQLEEDLPYGLSQAHMGMILHPQKKVTEALVAITQSEQFTPFFEKMIANDVSPNVLTTQVSLYENYILNTTQPTSNAFCILDIGHHTTYAYFFYHKKLVSVHTSFIAGKTISETISENYNIDMEEATIYKHQNCFFLTSDQLDKVEESQRYFAQLMHKTMQPLIAEIRRWELGFRITHGLQVREVLLTGGSSNIKNISSYMTEELGIDVNYFNSYELVNTDKIDHDQKQLRKFNNANLQTICYPRKSKIINLLHGQFAIKGVMDLPLHSFAFIATRACALTFLILIGMIIENYFIHTNIDSADKVIKSLTKNRILNLTNRQKRLALSKPKVLHQKLKSKNRLIKQEVKSLQSAVEINALSSLVKISNIIKDSKAQIIQFNGTSMSDFTVVISGEDTKQLEELNLSLNASNFNDIFIDFDEQNKKITMTASE